MYLVGKSGPQDHDARHNSFTVYSRRSECQQQKSQTQD